MKFVPQDEQIMNLKPLLREPQVRQNERLEVVTRPGREIVRETIVQPIVQKEQVDFRVQRGDDAQIELEPITEATRINNVVKSKTLNIPGKEVITQPIQQEFYQQNDIHHILNPYFERVPITRNVPIPVPVLEKQQIIRRIPVPQPKKPSGSFITRVNIRQPNPMPGLSDEEDHALPCCEDLPRRRYFEGAGNEASWIQEGMDKALGRE